MPRYWTVEEACAALPEVIALLERLREALARQAAAGSTAVAAPGTRASLNGHGASRSDDPAHEAARLLERITAMGVQVKDVAAGLIDFPYLRQGEEVLLCYRMGEPELAYWHDLHSGFAGRRPLSEL